MHQRAPPHLFGTKLPFCVRSLKEGESGGTNFLWPNALFPPPPPPPIIQVHSLQTFSWQVLLAQKMWEIGRKEAARRQRRRGWRRRDMWQNRREWDTFSAKASRKSQTYSHYLNELSGKLSLHALDISQTHGGALSGPLPTESPSVSLHRFVLCPCRHPFWNIMSALRSLLTSKNREAFPLSRFGISATCGENKYF